MQSGHYGTRKDSLISSEFKEFSEKSLDIQEEEKKLYMGPAKLNLVHYACVLLFVLVAASAVTGAVYGWMD